MKKGNVFTEKVNKITFSANNDKRMQSINSINSTEIDSYETNKEIAHRKEEIKCNNIIKQCEKWLTMGMKEKKT